MRVFVTGASGHIGLPVVSDLLAAGHKVIGLARSDGSAEKVSAAGAEVLRSTLDDLDKLKEAAKSSDGVIHLAFKHDLAFAGGDFAGAVAADLRAVEAIGEALAGSGKPFVNTSGTMLLAHSVRGRAGTEDDVGQEGGNPRVASESISLAFARRGVRTSIILGGFIGMIAQLDNPTSSARTRELLGWKPTHADLVADIAAGHYFAMAGA